MALKSSEFINKSNLYVLIAISVIYGLITLAFSWIPFWGDISMCTEQAAIIYQKSIHLTYKDLVIINGIPDLYILYIVGIWKLFGHTLLISHLAILPFMIGIVYEFQKLSSRYLLKHFVPITLLFLLFEPSILTQFILMGYDILIVYLFLLALNAILNQQRIIYFIAIYFLLFISGRGIAMVGIITLIDLGYTFYWKKNKFIYSHYLAYLPIILCYLFLKYLSYQDLGWLVFDTKRISNRSFLGFYGYLRNILYICWRILDYGRVFIIGFIGIMIFRESKKGLSKTSIKLLGITGLIILMISLFIIPFSNPVSHRYFLVVYLFLILVMVYYLQFIQSSLIRNCIILLLIVGSITGNYWKYPQKYGNGWDSSLKCLSFFKIYPEAISSIQQLKLKEKEIGVRFPLFSDTKCMYLTNESFLGTNIAKTPLDSFRYILYSNVCNNYPMAQLNQLNTYWHIEREFKSGEVFIRLYKKK